MTAVEFRDLRRDYAPATIIGPINLTIAKSQSFGFIGSNGAGKTTIMRMMVGLEPATAGSVEVWGEPVRAGFRPADIGAMIEEPRFYRWLSAAGNLRAVSGDRPEWLARIDEVLDAVGLPNDTRPVRAYSQGMRQRLGLARALLGNPRLLVLDEPTNGLDPQGIRWMRQMLRSLRTNGTTVILSSHLLHEIEAICDHYAVIGAGQVLASGEVSELRGQGSLEDLYFELTEEAPGSDSA